MYPGLAYSFHSALKGGILYRVGIVGDNFEKPENDGDNNHYGTKKKGDDEVQSNIAVISQQSSSS